MKYPEVKSVEDLGRIDTAAATGAVSDTKKAMAYAKQNATNTESIVAMLGGSVIQLRTAQSISATVEEDALQQFSISVMDVDSGSVALADIDITSISAVIEKSTGGGAFADTGLTAITFGKEDGRVFVDYQFKAAEWAIGDVYKIVVSGITATISGDTAYIPAMIWSNLIVTEANLRDAVDGISLDIGDFTGRTYDGTLLDVLGLPDVDGKDLYTCLVTDRLDEAAHGLAALKTLGDLQATAAVQGALDTVANTGAVDDATTAIAYAKQLVTLILNGTYGLSALQTLLAAIPTTMVGTDDAALATDLATMQTDVTHLELILTHDAQIFPSLPSLDCVLTAGVGADTFGAWAEIEDNTVGTTLKLSAVFASHAGHISVMAAEYLSENAEVYMVELAYGAAKTEICNFRIKAGTNNLPVTQVPRIQGVHIPSGETVYYRMAAETGESTANVAFRYYLDD